MNVTDSVLVCPGEIVPKLVLAMFLLMEQGFQPHGCPEPLFVLVEQSRALSAEGSEIDARTPVAELHPLSVTDSVQVPRRPVVTCCGQFSLVLSDERCWPLLTVTQYPLVSDEPNCMVEDVYAAFRS